MTNMKNNTLISRYQAIKQQIPNHVNLLAVSKTKPSDMIRTLAEVGQQHFGENYVQEAIGKIQQLKDIKINGEPIIWHYIGHIQRNKTRDLATHFDWVHGVDRLIIAERLNEQRKNHVEKLNICIQVNIDDEATKSGCHADELPELIAKISQLPNLRLRGLMIIPAKNSEMAFVKTKQLFENNRQFHANPTDWDSLSMGMSGDIEQAVEAGSTMVRVGTAIFGER